MECRLDLGCVALKVGRKVIFIFKVLILVP